MAGSSCWLSPERTAEVFGERGARGLPVGLEQRVLRRLGVKSSRCERPEQRGRGFSRPSPASPFLQLASRTVYRRGKSLRPAEEAETGSECSPSRAEGQQGICVDSHSLC